MNEVLKKELYVAVHGQSARFRIMKYAILIPLFAALYWWGVKWGEGPHCKAGLSAGEGGGPAQIFSRKLCEGEVLAWALGVLFILALAVHFFFRYKSNGWQDDWWLYKSVLKK